MAETITSTKDLLAEIDEQREAETDSDSDVLSNYTDEDDDDDDNDNVVKTDIIDNDDQKNE